MLTDRDKERYTRQLLIQGWGEEGQEKLKTSKVLVAGAGGLGSPVAFYLAAAGIGTIVICDEGELELGNLNRQILYWESDLGVAKADAAAERIFELNRDIEVIPENTRIDDDSIGRLADDADLIVDCLDNFTTRYVLNKYSVANKVPFVHAGISGFAGQLTFISPPETPCLSCIFPSVPESDTAIPVLGATPGVLGSLAAMEACKYLLGMPKVLKGRLLIWDGEEQVFDIVEIIKSETCPVCGI